MGVGIFNLVVGLVALVAGLSGEFALIGTDSSEALAGVGGVIAAIGVYQIVKSARASDG